MWRKILILLVCVVGIFGFVSQVFSIGDKPAAKKKSVVQKSPEVLQVAGNITSTDANSSTITVSIKEGKSLTLVVDKKTTLSKSGKNIKLSDVKNGDFVKITYERRKDKNIAKSVYLETNSIASPVSQPKKRLR